jgi:dihydrofolate reductase
MLALIVAVAHNRVIGKDNTLIWHLPNDLKFFKEKTTGHVIIMGRKTFESLPFLLPNREHWVITRDKGFDAPEGVKIFHSPEAAAEAARALVYEAFLPYVDTMYITEVDHEFEGDAFFPEFQEGAFTIESVVDGVVDEKNTYPHRFVTYRRKASK